MSDTVTKFDSWLADDGPAAPCTIAGWTRVGGAGLGHSTAVAASAGHGCAPIAPPSKPTCRWCALPGPGRRKGEALSTVHRLAWQNQTTRAEVYLFFEVGVDHLFWKSRWERGPVRRDPCPAHACFMWSR